jgi:hypothetical protein
MTFQEERRDTKSQRIPFEAIVELGGEVDPNAAFEAQGVDVSATGMHLRTAYLPEIGQPLLCRFGSGAQEISAEADVVWRREGSRGGEFGIRFTNLDGPSAAVLWDMCGMNRNEPGPEVESRRPEADPGTRVRLHIDGLGSPMKARVRGSTDAELLVGSNLEFLRVGRTLELEDVDHGGKRPAHIDRVDVEIDQASRVPQLVVTLRYDDVGADAVPVRASSPKLVSAPTVAMPEANITPDPGPRAPTAITTAEPVSAPVESSEEREAARRMRSKFSNAAADIMPKVTELGDRAKTTLGLLLSKAVERTKSRETSPRRTTSPPPTGALHATGKRVVRDGDDAEYDARNDVPKRKISKRGMLALGGTAGLLTVVTAMALHKSSSAPPGAQASGSEPNANATTAVQVADSMAGSQGALQANVPLFGPTTLSTTEPVAAAAPSLGAAPGAPAPGFGIPGAGSSPMETVDDRKSNSDEAGSSGKSHADVAPFGHGKLSHATVLRMKTDGEITAIHGARTPTGFTVTIPGRRSMESGPSLAGRDTRIASVHVSNNSKGSELAFQFKDGVPPYLVRAKGHDLQISIGRAGETDDPSKDGPQHGSTAQKRAPETHHRSKRD